jgi:hypothetical protein
MFATMRDIHHFNKKGNHALHKGRHIGLPLQQKQFGFQTNNPITMEVI